MIITLVKVILLGISIIISYLLYLTHSMNQHYLYLKIKKSLLQIFCHTFQNKCAYGDREILPSIPLLKIKTSDT